MQVDTNDFELGDTVEDTTTGFRGIVVGITQWLTGCARASLQPRIDKDGKVPDAQTFDVLTLTMVKRGPRHATAAASGGPGPVAARRPDPTR